MKTITNLPADNRLIILVYSDFTRDYIFSYEIKSLINIIGWYNV